MGGGRACVPPAVCGCASSAAPSFDAASVPVTAAGTADRKGRGAICHLEPAARKGGGDADAGPVQRALGPFFFSTIVPLPLPPPLLPDKLAETKRAERERKEAHKADLAAAKAKKAADRADAATLHRAERAAAHVGTARERADERAAAKKAASAARAEAGGRGVCEHGVTHCKVCGGRGSGRAGGKSRWLQRG